MELNTFLDLCSGIGGGRLGLEQVGMKSIGYSDTSRLSATTYRLMFNTDGELNYGNLKKIKTERLPQYDVLIAGFPCQTFSVIGRREGFDDIRGQIIFHIARILSETKPKAFILENVKGLVTHDKGKTIKTILELLNDAGFDVVYKVLTSLDYGVPQMRQRVYFIGVNKELGLNIEDFQWPEHRPVPPLSDYLVDEQPIPEWMEEYLPGYLNNDANGGKFSMSDLLAMDGKVLDTRMSDLRIYDGKVPTLRSQRDGVLYVKGGHLYSLTGHEALLLQGFPREYADKVYNVVSDRHLLMQAGNAMTVNVIQALGEQLIALFKSIKKSNKNNNKTMALQDWEIFERECADYLNRKYSGKTGCQFIPSGGHNSHEPDIYVKKGGKSLFSMETKMAGAQCGQFVLFPNDSTMSFAYSQRNEFPLNQYSKKIIEEMEKNYYDYNTPSTKPLAFDKKLFYDWVKNHYKVERGSKYLITKGNNYVVFNIDNFEKYYDISAVFRIKKSGSSNPSSSDLIEIQSLLDVSCIRSRNLHSDGHYVEVELPDFDGYKLVRTGGKFDFQMKRIDGNTFRITKLSNTYNANVIFSISLKREQGQEDISEFESEIAK